MGPSNTTLADNVTEQMAVIAKRVKDEREFKPVRPARWHHLPTGLHLETGYCYGEGRYRIYQGVSRTPLLEQKVLGRESDMLEFTGHFGA